MIRVRTNSSETIRWGCVVIFTLFAFILPHNTNAQIVLQLERFNHVKTQKFVPGFDLIIKQKDFPDVWSRKTIEDILVTENTIVFNDLIVPLDHIIGVRHERGTVKAISRKLYQFGFTWLAYAGVLQLLDRYDIGRDTFVVAGSSFALGYGLKALFFRKTFTIGKNSRLRILDLNMYQSNFD